MECLVRFRELAGFQSIRRCLDPAELHHDLVLRQHSTFVVKFHITETSSLRKIHSKRDLAAIYSTELQWSHREQATFCKVNMHSWDGLQMTMKNFCNCSHIPYSIGLTFEPQAVRIWNDLPAEITNLPLNKFKKCLKSHLWCSLQLISLFFELSQFFSFNFSFRLKCMFVVIIICARLLFNQWCLRHLPQGLGPKPFVTQTFWIMHCWFDSNFFYLFFLCEMQIIIINISCLFTFLIWCNKYFWIELKKTSFPSGTYTYETENLQITFAYIK